MRTLTPPEAAERLRAGALYLDVRTPEEFEEGHPEGAWNVPLQLRAEGGGLEDNPNFSKHAEALLDPAREVIVGCRSGPRAERARALLTHLVDATVMLGGMEGRRDAFGELLVPGWKQHGLPISHDDTGR